jgi:hypothetical protein
MKRSARRAATATHILVLGPLLFLAVIKLVALATEARVFRYQGF